MDLYHGTRSFLGLVKLVQTLHVTWSNEVSVEEDQGSALHRAQRSNVQGL